MKSHAKKTSLALALAALLAALAPVQAQSILWKDGEYAAAGLPSPLPAGVVVHASTGVAPKSFAGDLTVNGTLRWDSAESADFSGAHSRLRNNGLVDFTGDGWLKPLASGVRFINAGTLRKSGGSGELLVDLLLQNAAGATLEAGSGALRYRGGGAFAAGTVFAGEGRHVFDAADGFVFAGSFTAANDKLHLARGTFLNGFSSTAQLDFGVDLSWSGGTLQGGWRNAAGRTLTALDGGDKVTASSFDNDGTIVWNGSGGLGLDSADGRYTTELRNRGVLDFRADSALSALHSETRLANVGLLRKSGGSGELLIGVAAYGLPGSTFDAASGSIRYTGGGQMGGDTRFTGSGWHIFDTAHVFGFGSGNVFTKSRLHFARGEFAVTSSLRLAPDAELLWSGGTFFGAWAVAAGHTTTVVDGHDKVIRGGFVNDGVVAWNSRDALGLGGGTTVLRNNGLFQFAGDGWLRALAGNVTFDNAGTLRKAGGSGELLVDVFLHNRSGATLDAGSGSIYYAADGALEAGTVFGGAGRHVFDTTGSYTFGGHFTAAGHNLRFVRGSFVNGGAARLDLATDLAWSGGVLQGPWGNAAGRTLTASTGFDKVFAGDFSNDGHIEWNTGDSVFFRNAGSRLQNNGVFHFAGDGWLRPLAGGVVFHNAGVLRKGGGSGELRVGTGLVNTGAIEALAGTIVLPVIWQNAGSLRGTAAFSNQRIDNKGDIAPGLPGGGGRIATLHVSGRLDNLPGGTLSFDVGLGGSSDLLLVGGEARLDGVLRVFAADGYRPAVGDTFHVMSFASVSGAFDDVAEFGFAPGVVFTALLGATGLDLRVSAVPEAPGWLLLCAGQALLVVWRRIASRPPAAGS